MLEDFGGSIQDILLERNETHGSFAENARIAQGIKAIIRTGANWSRLTPIQKEAFDQKASKWGRILSGNPNFADHWNDDIGYSTLVLEECDEPK